MSCLIFLSIISMISSLKKHFIDYAREKRIFQCALLQGDGSRACFTDTVMGSLFIGGCTMMAGHIADGDKLGTYQQCRDAKLHNNKV